MWRWMLNRRVAYPREHISATTVLDRICLSWSCPKQSSRTPALCPTQAVSSTLGIADYTWYADSEGYLHGETGLHLTARDMAKIGVLYLQHGRWERSRSFPLIMCGTPPPAQYGGRRSTPVTATNGGSARNRQRIFRVRKEQSVHLRQPRTAISCWLSRRIRSPGAGGFVRNVVLPITEGCRSRRRAWSRSDRHQRQIIHGIVIASQ